MSSAVIASCYLPLRRVLVALITTNYDNYTMISIISGERVYFGGDIIILASEMRKEESLGW